MNTDKRIRLDYIKEGVRLADGFKYEPESDKEGFWGEEIILVPGCGWQRFQKPERSVLDALAAQLVRQVDALPHFDLVVHDDWTEIQTDFAKDSCGQWFVEAEHAEEGRTMNTIKAIVDSKVLEK